MNWYSKLKVVNKIATSDWRSIPIPDLRYANLDYRMEVIKELLDQDFTIREIAQKTKLSGRTIERYVKRISGKNLKHQRKKDRYTTNLMEQVVQMYRPIEDGGRGLNVNQIAKIVGLNRKAIISILKYKGIEYSAAKPGQAARERGEEFVRRKWGYDLMIQVVQMHMPVDQGGKGMNVNQIANTIGTTSRNVLSILKVMGAEYRPSVLDPKQMSERMKEWWAKQEGYYGRLAKLSPDKLEKWRSQITKWFISKGVPSQQSFAIAQSMITRAKAKSQSTEENIPKTI